MRRETFTCDQLHLADDHRLRAGRSTISYFSRIYGFDTAPDRKELTIEEPVPQIPVAAPEQLAPSVVDQESANIDLMADLMGDIIDDAVESSWIRSHLDVEEESSKDDQDTLIVNLLEEEEKENDNWWEG